MLHHSIEERHIFPVLAKRIPAFKEEHIESHKGIHDGKSGHGFRTSLSPTYPSTQGVGKLSVLVSKYTDEPSCYSPTELRNTLDDFREVLFKHMDDEVCN